MANTDNHFHQLINRNGIQFSMATDCEDVDICTVEFDFGGKHYSVDINNGMVATAIESDFLDDMDVNYQQQLDSFLNTLATAIGMDIFQGFADTHLDDNSVINTGPATREQREYAKRQSEFIQIQEQMSEEEMKALILQYREQQSM